MKFKLVQRFKKERVIRQTDQCVQQGDLNSALAKINGILKEYPNDIQLLIQKSWILCEQNKFEEALQTVHQELHQHAAHPVLHMILGEIFYGLQQYEQAKQALHSSLQYGPDNMRAEYLLGLVYVALGQLDQASQYFESSIAYDKTLVQKRLLVMAEHYLFSHRTKGLHDAK